MNDYDMPTAYRYNAEALGDDPRRWGFVRNTNLPRGSLGGAPFWMTMKRWRWGAIAVLLIVLVLLKSTGTDMPNW